MHISALREQERRVVSSAAVATALCGDFFSFNQLSDSFSSGFLCFQGPSGPLTSGFISTIIDDFVSSIIAFGPLNSPLALWVILIVFLDCNFRCAFNI